MRGEHKICNTLTQPSNGSSPHARGTLFWHCCCTAKPRFIPACAGNTPGISQSHEWHAVHPRMRGEHDLHTGKTKAPSGSSPHARGTLQPHDPRRITHRFIPACAGNTSATTFRPSLRPVHPRMRGEHLVNNRATHHTHGSSPHARGTPPV